MMSKSILRLYDYSILESCNYGITKTLNKLKYINIYIITIIDFFFYQVILLLIYLSCDALYFIVRLQNVYSLEK